ncbi:MAG TPA: hypothetical protein VL221_01915 [Bacteroidota bacterium]|nr:hypothetical protein [Bacteroidota bacterium]
MHNKRGGVAVAAAILLGAGAALLGGCSSSPGQAELQQLDDLKKEVADLQHQVADRESTKATLDKEIADSNARLKKCHDDEAVVRERLGK